MSSQYTDTELYNQLLFFSSLFDSEKILSSSKGSSQQGELISADNHIWFSSPHLEHISALVAQNTITLELLCRTTEKYLAECGRRWVDLEDLFSFMTFVPKGVGRT